MAKKDIWAQLDEYQKANKSDSDAPEKSMKNAVIKEGKQKKRKKASGGGLVGSAKRAKQGRSSFIQSAIDKALGRK